VDIETYMREARRFDNHRPEAMLDALVHGLMAEVGEVWGCLLDRDYGLGVLHEMGDVAWNVARLADVVGVPPAELVRDQWEPAVDDLAAAGELVRHAAAVAGLLEKSHRIVKFPWDLHDRIAQALHETWQALECYAGWHRYGMDVVMRTNIDKLTARYAERGLTVKEAS
jgi:hypothetical protein